MCAWQCTVHSVEMQKVAAVELSWAEPSSAKTKLRWILHWCVQACDGKNRNCIHYRRHFTQFGVQQRVVFALVAGGNGGSHSQALQNACIKWVVAIMYCCIRTGRGKKNTQPNKKLEQQPRQHRNAKQKSTSKQVAMARNLGDLETLRRFHARTMWAQVKRKSSWSARKYLNNNVKRGRERES